MTSYQDIEQYCAFARKMMQIRENSNDELRKNFSYIRISAYCEISFTNFEQTHYISNSVWRKFFKKYVRNGNML